MTHIRFLNMVVTFFLIIIDDCFLTLLVNGTLEVNRRYIFNTETKRCRPRSESSCMPRGTASALSAGGRGFDPRPRLTKDVQMVPVDPLFDAEHIKGKRAILSNPRGDGFHQE